MLLMRVRNLRSGVFGDFHLGPAVPKQGLVGLRRSLVRDAKSSDTRPGIPASGSFGSGDADCSLQHLEVV
jgi:hypothetical protein